MLSAAVASPAAADEAAIARGAYLAAAAGCDACHTDAKNGGAPYAGGRMMQTEFGVIATPNITPDRETGIGRWDKSDFERALRWGIAPDGSHYVPAFPFPYFAGLTDRDLADLKVFLDNLPPLSRPAVGSASLALVQRARAALGTALQSWPMAPNSSLPPAAADPPAARGAYLVDTVGHCGACHTPRTWLG
ncbi:MAG: c-type cytochrome, partial [Alphaproteobacteria bacterium]|nr:c-type cytochrome [Alphaproteobacteria bacterium]